MAAKTLLIFFKHSLAEKTQHRSLKTIFAPVGHHALNRSMTALNFLNLCDFSPPYFNTSRPSSVIANGPRSGDIFFLLHKSEADFTWLHHSQNTCCSFQSLIRENMFWHFIGRTVASHTLVLRLRGVLVVNKDAQRLGKPFIMATLLQTHLWVNWVWVHLTTAVSPVLSDVSDQSRPGRQHPLQTD